MVNCGFLHCSKFRSINEWWLGCCVCCSGRLLLEEEQEEGVITQLDCGKTCSRSAVNLWWIFVLNFLYTLLESSVLLCWVVLLLLLHWLDDEQLFVRLDSLLDSNIWRNWEEDVPDLEEEWLDPPLWLELSMSVGDDPSVVGLTGDGVSELRVALFDRDSSLSPPDPEDVRVGLLSLECCCWCCWRWFSVEVLPLFM